MDQAQPIDDPVRHLGRDDFLAQRMGGDGVGFLVLHRRGEGRHQLADHAVVAGKVAMLDRVLQRQLGGGKQHCQFGARQALAILAAPEQLVIGGQPFDLAIEAARFLEGFDEPDIARQIVAAACFRDGEAQRLEPVILQHQIGDGIGHAFQQGVARVEGQAAFGHLLVERDLDVDLIVRTIDAGAIVDEVGIDAPALEREGDAARLSDAQVRAFADHPNAQLLGIDPQPVVGRVADVALALRGGLHIGADAAEPEKVSRRLEDGGNERGGLHLRIGDVQYRLHLGRQRDALQAAREDAAALGDERLVIVFPAGARQLEQAVALLPAARRIGRRIEEDMAMIEGGDQLDRLAQQHAIAEHVARHVAAADNADRLALHVDAHFGEMTLHRNPGAASGDAHRLMVIAVGAAAGEGIAQPEVAILRDRIGDVAEGRGALVRRDDEIGVVAVAHDDFGRVRDIALDDIVGDRQQRADEDAVAFRTLGQPGVPVDLRAGQLLGIEAALCAGRHDDSVLDTLRLHEAQNFGAEIVAPVGPAQAAASDRPRAQVDALDARAVHPDLTPGQRRRQTRDLRAV